MCFAAIPITLCIEGGRGVGWDGSICNSCIMETYFFSPPSFSRIPAALLSGLSPVRWFRKKPIYLKMLKKFCISLKLNSSLRISWSVINSSSGSHRLWPLPLSFSLLPWSVREMLSNSTPLLTVDPPSTEEDEGSFNSGKTRRGKRSMLSLLLLSITIWLSKS